MGAALFPVLGVCLVAPLVASAQASEVITIVRERSNDEALMGASGSLADLCERAAAQEWAVEYRIFGDLMRCSARPLREGLGVLTVTFSVGQHVYLIARGSVDMRVIHRLDEIEWFPTEAGAVEVTRLSTWPMNRGPSVVAIETRAEYINFENTEALGWNRRRITLCSALRTGWACRLSLPLAFESWAGRSPNGGFAPVDGFEVTERAEATAVAVVRRDGTVRHRMRSGAWALLAGGAWVGVDDAPQRRRRTVWRIADGAQLR